VRGLAFKLCSYAKYRFSATSIFIRMVATEPGIHQMDREALSFIATVVTALTASRDDSTSRWDNKRCAMKCFIAI